MAQRPVEGRQLNPIYNALDARNYKQAIKLADGILKKNSTSHIVKVLKALALERRGDHDSSLKLCREVRDDTPTDETVLNTLHLVYKHLGCVDELANVYEHAWKAASISEEMAVGYFCLCARRGDYIKQQQIALKMQRMFGNDKYLFWGVMSLTLQVKEKGEHKLLLLAEKMLEKAGQDGRIKSLEVLGMYIRVLEQQGKYQEVIDVVNGPLSTVFPSDIERSRVLVDAFLNLNDRRGAHKAYEDLLVNNGVEDWQLYKDYITNLFQAVSEAGVKDRYDRTSEDDMSVNSITKVFQSLQASEDENRPRRGPYLAELEIEERLLAGGHSTDSSHLERLLVSYMERFGSKPCMSMDVRSYLRHVTGASRQSLVDQMRDTIPPKSDSYAHKLRRMQYIVNVEKAERMVGLHDDEGFDKEGKAHQVLELYRESLELGKDKEVTERGVADDLLLIACHLLLDAKPGDVCRLAEVLCVLHWGLGDSRENFQFKLLAMACYQRLGAVVPMWKLYLDMDMKHIQMETLSHLVIPSCVFYNAHEEFTSVSSQLDSFHEENLKETPDLIVVNYKYDTFSKVREFEEFKDRLVRSFQHQTCRYEEVGLFVHQHFNDPDAVISRLNSMDLATVLCVEDEWLSALRFNQDESIVTDWESYDKATSTTTLMSTAPVVAPAPTSPSSYHLHSLSHPDHLAILKAQCLSVAALKAIVNDSTVSDCVTSWSKALDEISHLTQTEGEGADVKYIPSYWKCLDACLHLGSLFVGDTDDGAVVENFVAAFDSLCSSLANPCEDASLKLRHSNLFLTHILSWVCVMVSHWSRKYGKKRSKKVDGPNLKPQLELLKSSVCESLTKVVENFKSNVGLSLELVSSVSDGMDVPLVDPQFKEEVNSNLADLFTLSAKCHKQTETRLAFLQNLTG